MVELQAERDGARALTRRLPQLEREYRFWMDGAEGLAPGAAHRRVVRLADGSLLNRYWDDLAIPRDEAYLEDIETARNSWPARGGGVSGPARGGGKRLGLQLTLARGRQDPELDPHDGHRAGGSQQPAVQAGAHHRARLQGGEAARLRKEDAGERARATGDHAPVDVGRQSSTRSSTTTGATKRGIESPDRRDRLSIVRRSRRRPAGAARRATPFARRC